MATLFDTISTADVITAIVVGCGLLALINFTSFGGRKAASTAR